MKTVKEVSKITGLSIRTLRYYDEIGLIKPTQITNAKYRLYDSIALEKLQEIMFFKELDIPLDEIKKVMSDPNYDKEQVLLTQKLLLEQKRNRLNGIIELITDVMKGVNTMSFGAFNDDEIREILDHTLENMKKEFLEEQIVKYGSEENYRKFLATGFQNEQAMTDLIKWYGSKEKAIEAVLSSQGDENEIKKQQDDTTKVYMLFVKAKETDNLELANDAVSNLATIYKEMFQLDNARNILLDLAKEYLQQEKLAEATDNQYGIGISEYIGKAIQFYYGIIS